MFSREHCPLQEHCGNKTETFQLVDRILRTFWATKLEYKDFNVLIYLTEIKAIFKVVHASLLPCTSTLSPSSPFTQPVRPGAAAAAAAAAAGDDGGDGGGGDGAAKGVSRLRHEWGLSHYGDVRMQDGGNESRGAEWWWMKTGWGWIQTLDARVCVHNSCRRNKAPFSLFSAVFSFTLVWSPAIWSPNAGLAEDEAAGTSGFILNNLCYSQDHPTLLLSYIHDVNNKGSPLLLLVNTGVSALHNHFHWDGAENTPDPDGYIPHTGHDNAPQPAWYYHHDVPLNPVVDQIIRISVWIWDYISFPRHCATKLNRNLLKLDWEVAHMSGFSSFFFLQNMRKLS